MLLEQLILNWQKQKKTELAGHIIRTKGLLCSSCQVIYIDTDNYDEVLDFCKQFFPVLENEAKKHLPQTIDSRAELTLRKYTDTLEGFLSDSEKQEFICQKLFREKHMMESIRYGVICVLQTGR